MASESLGLQIFGALIKWRPRAFWAFILGVTPITIAISFILSPNDKMSCVYFWGLTLFVWLVFKTCRQLIDIFSLRKQEEGITWCYILILLFVGFWVLGFVIIFNIMANDRMAIAIGVVGSLLTIIFQERIRGAMTFMWLRMNHLLNIGDRIIVPKYNVDGEVKRITLTSVTIYNRDTTLSSIPLSALNSDHFKNLQHMVDGKTYGRKMSMTFILDTSWFRPLSQNEIVRLRERVCEYSQRHDVIDGNGTDAIHDNLVISEIEDGMLNVSLFRIYFLHWLMNNKHVSHQPRLTVSWQDQVKEGMPLDVCVFITETKAAAYRHHQSRIVEHFIESLDWFGLRLYQAPSAFDLYNRGEGVSQEIPSYKKEITDDI